MNSSPKKISKLAATKDSILDTAERLFAEHGYEGTALRQLTDEARVNLAAVHYHFGDKESLFKAIFVRKFRPLGLKRLALLNAAEQLAGDQTIPLRSIIDAFARPAFELACGDQYFVRMMARIQFHPPPFMHAVLAQEFRPVSERFNRTLQATLPHLPEAELFCRVQFVVGAMLHTLARIHLIEKMSGGLCHGDDYEGTLRRFVDFAVAGLNAPVPATLGL